MIKGIIFDLDGVILDSNDEYNEVFMTVAKKHGLHVSSEEIYSRFGKHPREIAKEVFGDKYKEEAYQEFIHIISRPNFSKKIKMFKGAKKSLMILKKHYKLFLATGGLRVVLEPIMKNVHIENSFDTILTIDDINKPSPKTEMIKIILKKYRLAPKEVVYVGDGIPDIHAAKMANVRSIAVLTGAMNLEDAKQHNADFIVESINDVEELVKCLNGFHGKV
jgi:pyrophosphatase PpaX